MCKFFSCVSDGKGTVKFFDVKEIVEQMSIGNPKDYSWNSHTSICQFFGINSLAEDLWNKWEYDPFKKNLVPDSRPVGVSDDSPQVVKILEEFFKGKNIEYLQNLYNRNSGNGNSGNWNSGNGNSGDWNSGNRNSGNGNSGNGILNSFCTKRQYFLFDKACTEEEYMKIGNLPWGWFDLTLWISGGDMTEQEKKDHPYWETTGGYLKHVSYKDAWAKCPEEFITKVKKLKNFDAKKFEEISGLKV